MMNQSHKNFSFQLLFIFFLTALAYSNILANYFLSFEYIKTFSGEVFLNFNHSELWLWGKRLAESFTHLFQLNITAYHVLSIALHLINVFVVYKIVFKILNRNIPAVLTALLFGIHPAQTEAVAQLTNYVVLLGSLGMLGAFYWFLKSIEFRSPKANRYQYFSLGVIFVTSLFFRQALIFPALIFTYLTTRKDKEAVTQTLPYVLISGVIIIAALLKPGENISYWQDSVYLNVLTAMKALGQYILTAATPIMLSYDPVLSHGVFGRFPQDFDKFQFLTQSIDFPVLITVVLVLAITWFVQKTEKTNPLTVWGAGWFFICLIPALSLWPTRIFYSESYLYIANFGYVFLLAVIISSWIENKSVTEPKTFLAWLSICTVVVFCVTQTWIRNLDWRNDKNFYASAVQTNPESQLLKYKLAESYIRGMESDKGISMLKAMIQQNPSKSELYVLLAEGYRNFNQYKMAVAALEQAIAVDPQNGDAYFKLSEIYALWKLNRLAYENLDKAVYYYRKQGKLQEAERIEDILERFIKSLNVSESNP